MLIRSLDDIAAFILSCMTMKSYSPIKYSMDFVCKIGTKPEKNMF